MEKNTPVFETGATSGAVNELILYTDNTRKLVSYRDAIYELYETAHMQPERKNMLSLLDKAQMSYYKEFGVTDDNKHVHNMDSNQCKEYCQIYANRFAEWKREKERQQK